ncbi:MAG: hypothetical protein BYD32DRAFT_422785 [Podila humilis]|nr:MAG: hypothetical protein BYD32DRAFT_422785 [Podila humilis]
MMSSQLPFDDFSTMYTTIFEQEDAASVHNHVNAFINSLVTPPGSPFDESLPGSPESIYSCLSSDESSPYMPVAHTIDNNNTYDPNSDSLASLFNFVMNDELFPRHAVCGSDEFSSIFGSVGESDALAQFNYNNYNTNDCGQQLARHIHRHHHASISQLMTSTAEPYPVCTSPDLLTVDKSLKAPKIRVSRRSPSVTSDRCYSQSPEPCSTPSSPVISSNCTVINNGDGSIMLIDSETGAATFKCKLCPDTSFGRIHDYQRHQASKHQAITFPCEFCTKLFARRDALLRHYNVKSSRHDGTHPSEDETEKLTAARARAKLLRA